MTPLLFSGGCIVVATSGSRSVTVSKSPEKKTSFRQDYLAALRERENFLKQTLAEMEKQHSIGAIRPEDVWKTRMELDIAKIRRMRFERSGESRQGMPEAMILRKYREQCAQEKQEGHNHGNVSLKELMESKTAASQAKLESLEAGKRKNYANLPAAASVLKRYPQTALTDGDLNLLLNLE